MADGTRTRDHRDHNPGLYQLSYRHRDGASVARIMRRPGAGASPSPLLQDVLGVRLDQDAVKIEDRKRRGKGADLPIQSSRSCWYSDTVVAATASQEKR